MEGDYLRHSRNQQLLSSLRESIVDKPPYISGTLQLPASCFSVYYRSTKDCLAARYINLVNATPDELEQLTQACEPASFGVKQETVLDETYRKAGKIDSECFASMLDPPSTDLIKIIRGYLLEGLQSEKGIKAELYKLNIYGKGSFFKPHVDTPRGEKMFGSLVVVFPTPHEGGALFLRHRGHEWNFDSAQALAGVNQPTIGYVAFFSDIEHEVAPVTSGHRITLTFNLYFDDGSGPVSENDAVSKYLIPPQPPNQEGFREAFNALLGNPEFMADGGTLAFGLRHVYPIKEGLEHVYDVLKGNDAVVYQSMRALGFDPVLYVYYGDDGDDSEYRNSLEGVMVDTLVHFCDSYSEEESVLDIVQGRGGIPVRQEDGDDSDLKDPETVEWVTPLTTYNRKQDAFATYGNSAALSWAYGDVCMIVRIGKAGDRLAFPTVDQVKRAYKRRGYYYHGSTF
ncbi:hypothetical protein BGY98DRAFT_1189584 [Russula aff. rugulosa BPL654]|nr:hypothetical protein BGY98DRAFT_1189584 [Russula aff. rugulosa BPL654]